PPGDSHEIQVSLSLLRRDPRVLVESIFYGAKRIDRIDARNVVFYEGAGQPVDDVARADAIHTFPLGLVLQLADVFGLEALDIFTIIQFHFLGYVDIRFLGLLEPGHHSKHRRDLQSVRSYMDAAQGFGLL